MVVKQRRFIRLEEIEKRANLTRAEVLDYIDDGELCLCARVSAKQMGAKYIYQKSFVIGAVFDYRGMVRLDEEDSKSLIASMEKKPVETVTILEPEKVQNWQSVSETFGSVEQYLEPYLKNKPAQPEKLFRAYPKVIYDITGFQGLGQSLMNLFPGDWQKNVEKEIQQLNTRYLQIRKLTVEPYDLRIDLQALERITGKTELSSSQAVTNVLPTLTHPIEQIVYRILKQDPDARADKIWNMMRSEFRQGGARQYDVDGVIESMSADDICWFGKGLETENEMSYAAFRKNTVYKVRKLVKRT